MVLDTLGSSLRNTLSKIKNSITVDRNLVEEIVKEIQKALLSSDVNVRLVLELTKKIRERAISENVEGLNKKEHLITIIYEEIANHLGKGEEFHLKEKEQNRILLVGLYGQGKTTSAVKLANYFKNRSKSVALISTDTWRPAAFEQLKQGADKIGVDVYGDPKEKDPNKIYHQFKKNLQKYDLVIIDSAGRDSLNEELINEIDSLKNEVNPSDIFFVLGADVGQTAQKQAEMFKEYMDISGVIITKMDGTGKGGGALSACAKAEAFVKFIGVGEKIEDLERFNSEKFVSQLLGMGDLESLLEKAKIAIDEKSAKKMQERFSKGEFDLNDLYEQMKAMNKMGSMTKLMGMIPGFSNLGIAKDDIKVQETRIKKWKYMMDSMTRYEKENPDQIDISRMKRITAGSGTSITSLRELLKQYKMMKKMFGAMNSSSGMEDIDPSSMENPQDMMKMMKKFGGNKALKQFMKRR
jgi:signal recognition particle subunit SRP54